MNIYDLAEQELATRWPVGTRVRYIGNARFAQGITGTVTNHSPGFDENLARYPAYDSVHIKLDGPPENWPYTSGTMAPSIYDLEKL